MAHEHTRTDRRRVWMELDAASRALARHDAAPHDVSRQDRPRHESLFHGHRIALPHALAGRRRTGSG
jgi:hypothetical protein